MTFTPPRCPKPICSNHTSPRAGFFYKRGSYWPKCRRTRVPRFQCRDCGGSFSRQTFRGDYRDRRPDTNNQVLSMLVAGTGLRQIARSTGLHVRAVQQKLAKFGRHCRALHDNLARQLPPNRTYLLDEEETYENASIRPLTVPIIIEREHWFIVSTAVGSIRRLATAGTARRRRQEADERKFGRRKDESSQRVQEALQLLARRAPTGDVMLQTDEKSSYRTIARRIFGSRVAHETTPGNAPRTTHNPLFPINTTIAMTRDNCGRLRRRSWLVSKKAEGLRQHLHVFTVYRNYVRRRFNYDVMEESSAQKLGLLPRALRWLEVIRWRQHWGKLSPHPMCRRGRRTVETVFPSLACA